MNLTSYVDNKIARQAKMPSYGGKFISIEKLILYIMLFYLNKTISFKIVRRIRLLSLSRKAQQYFSIFQLINSLGDFFVFKK